MKHLILAAATLLLMTGGEARERRGPPPACEQPKADCCPKPKCPRPCAQPQQQPPAPQQKSQPQFNRKRAAQPVQAESVPPACCEPCCPPVCFERGQASSECCIPAAYVEPANIDLRCGWDTFMSVSFTYWNVMQDGMDLALPGQATTVTPLDYTSVALSATGEKVLYQRNEFKPGFQIGLGWSGGADGWTLYTEYSWVRGQTHTSAAAPKPAVTSVGGVTVPPNGVWIPTNWFPSTDGISTSYENSPTTHLSSKWKYGLDILDAQVSRPSYIGTHFVLEPTFGLRALWIRQNLDIEAPILYTAGASLPGLTRSAHYQSHSWAIGPRAGFNGKWHLGWGLRFIGDAAGSLTYTRYTKVVQRAGPPINTVPIRMRIHHLGAIRPNMDLSLGLGWSSYFCCRRFHADLAATYDFSVFWQQNMMRNLADLASLASQPSAAPGNLYLQGLTIKAQFEF